MSDKIENDDNELYKHNYFQGKDIIGSFFSWRYNLLSTTVSHDYNIIE